MWALQITKQFWIYISIFDVIYSVCSCVNINFFTSFDFQFLKCIIVIYSYVRSNVCKCEFYTLTASKIVSLLIGCVKWICMSLWIGKQVFLNYITVYVTYISSFINQKTTQNQKFGRSSWQLFSSNNHEGTCSAKLLILVVHLLISRVLENI